MLLIMLDFCESLRVMRHNTRARFFSDTLYRLAQKNGASLSHCKYSEHSMTELHGNWWTSAVKFAEQSLTFYLKISSRCGAT